VPICGSWELRSGHRAYARQVCPMAQKDAAAGDPASIHYPKFGPNWEPLEREFGAKEEDRELVDLPEFRMQAGKDDASVVAGSVVPPEQRARVKTTRRLNRILAATLRSRQEAHTHNCVELREYLVNAAHV
jgi:hypothetical protein